MCLPPPSILTDDELEAVLAGIFRTASGGLTREGECFLATICARHVMDCLAAAGFSTVRPRDAQTCDGALFPVAKSGHIRDERVRQPD